MTESKLEVKENPLSSLLDDLCGESFMNKWEIKNKSLIDEITKEYTNELSAIIEEICDLNSSEILEREENSTIWSAVIYKYPECGVNALTEDEIAVRCFVWKNFVTHPFFETQNYPFNYEIQSHEDGNCSITIFVNFDEEDE